jgi:hypothetical protein
MILHRACRFSGTRVPLKQQARWVLSSLVVILSVALLGAVSVSAAAQISLPLNGYYRPGRYMPMRVSAADTDVKLSADGALSTLVQSRNGVLVPILIYGSPRELTTATERLPLHPVSEDERLIGSTMDAVETGHRLFPRQKIIPVSLTAADPLPGPAAAWEALDAVVTDSPAMSRLDDDRRSALLAAGIVLAATGDVAPDDRWPWKHDGKLWVLRDQPLGPTDRIVDEAIYSPTFAWAPGWSVAVRQEVFGAGVLLAILAIALFLWRSKATMAGIILLAVISSGTVAWWRTLLGPVNQAGGDVIVAANGLLQRDTWLYERARSDSPRDIAWSGWTHPVFASSEQIEKTGMQVRVSSDGKLSFTYRARRDETVAFIHREVGPETAPAATPSRSSPMQNLAREVYQSATDRILGETHPPPGRWPSVVIEHF